MRRALTLALALALVLTVGPMGAGHVANTAVLLGARGAWVRFPAGRRPPVDCRMGQGADGADGPAGPAGPTCAALRALRAALA
jgi:hypothetical protein